MMENDQMDVDIHANQPFHLVEDFNVCVVCKEGKTDRLVTDIILAGTFTFFYFLGHFLVENKIPWPNIVGNTKIGPFVKITSIKKSLDKILVR